MKREKLNVNRIYSLDGTISALKHGCATADGAARRSAGLARTQRSSHRGLHCCRLYCVTFFFTICAEKGALS